MQEFNGIKILVQGIVQGVGFRPFVYNLAIQLDLKGWIKNTSAGVEIEINGPIEKLNEFTHRLKNDLPPLAHIDTIDIQPVHSWENDTFEIQESKVIPQAFQPISPDISICEDCRIELFDPGDRRFRYPFINCTNCGPRFTIIKDIPYDRPLTTMSGFPMCKKCKEEYLDPTNRRFHAQPIACPICGPQIWFENTEGIHLEVGDQALTLAQAYLGDGKILAIKGIGGFHLACSAENPGAVQELRNRKLRIDKPFALMMANINHVKNHCSVNQAEAAALLSKERPIVLLERLSWSSIARETAPGQNTIGVMLPYTPLHYLLFESNPVSSNNSESLQALVMTSGNLSEEPIVTSNEDARERLKNIADFFLFHDRPIHLRCDDSVIRTSPLISSGNDLIAHDKQSFYSIRRSRGFAPAPFRLDWDSEPSIGCGAELKNTFCLTNNRYAFLSHHIGDLVNYETYKSYEDGISHLERLFKVKPSVIIYDLHPDYQSTRYALNRASEEGLKAIGVQHHHAHIAACMVDNHIPSEKTIIGYSFDGTGYGEDGAIWGGEVLLSTYKSFQRLAHFRYVPLLGGEQAIREPWRMGISWLLTSQIELSPDLAPVMKMLEKGIKPEIMINLFNHQPMVTSSIGRLFDACASIINLRHQVNYEGQAAIELEAIADHHEKSKYQFDIRSSEKENEPFQIDPTIMFSSIVKDLQNGVNQSIISARFHNTIQEIVHQLSILFREKYGNLEILLSGGVWQNMLLLRKTEEALRLDGFKVRIHHQVPANDGGISLGQVAVAAHNLF